jgi:hypothetical protein
MTKIEIINIKRNQKLYLNKMNSDMKRVEGMLALVGEMRER